MVDNGAGTPDVSVISLGGIETTYSSAISPDFGRWPILTGSAACDLGHLGNGQMTAAGSVFFTTTSGVRHPHDVRRPLLT